MAEVTRFLEDYYRGFELGDSTRLVGGCTRDFAGYFSIPSHGGEVLRFDAQAIAAGFGNALAQYRGRQPVMRVTGLTVLPRSETTAVAAYRMLFYLEGELRNDAVAIAELRIEGGRWKMYRLYEAKRR